MSRKVEVLVGLFMILVICSLLFLCFRVTDPTSFTSHSSYRVYAVFDNVGGLKVRSPIKIGGVVIGRISDISLESTDNETYKPRVTLDIESQYNKIPSSSALSIKTSGILGEQFIDVNLGMDRSMENDVDALDDDGSMELSTSKSNTPAYFENGFVVVNTVPAVSLEDLIGKFLYSTNSSDKTSSDNSQDSSNNSLK